MERHGDRCPFPATNANGPELMLAAQRLKIATRAAVRGSLSLDPVLVLAERVAGLVGRRWPDAYFGRALRFHVVDTLGQRVDIETRIARLPGGARLVVTLRDYALRELYFRGSRAVRSGWLYEPETTRFVMRWLRAGDTVLDVGANAGYYTAIAASIVGSSGEVHAFEPNSRVASLLRTTLDLNGFTDRAMVNEAAVNSTGAGTELFLPIDPGATGGATTMSRESNDVLPGLKVPGVTIDDYVKAKGIRAIRLIKIDVEGTEVDVLAGAKVTLDVLKPEALVCEFCPGLLADPRSTWAELLGQTKRFGYRPFLLASDGGLSPFEGGMPEWKVGNVCFLGGPS